MSAMSEKQLWVIDANNVFVKGHMGFGLAKYVHRRDPEVLADIEAIAISHDTGEMSAAESAEAISPYLAGVSLRDVMEQAAFKVQMIRGVESFFSALSSSPVEVRVVADAFAPTLQSLGHLYDTSVFENAFAHQLAFGLKGEGGIRSEPVKTADQIGDYFNKSRNSKVFDLYQTTGDIDFGAISSEETVSYINGTAAEMNIPMGQVVFVTSGSWGHDTATAVHAAGATVMLFNYPESLDAVCDASDHPERLVRVSKNTEPTHLRFLQKMLP